MPAAPSPGLDDPAVAGLVELLAPGGVMVLSGAGMSTDSGIPDYRGSGRSRPRGQPMTFKEFTGSAAARQRYWARSHVGWGTVARAAPNAAHRAVATLQRAGLLTGIVTQNVDRLHSAAGADDVIDLHGRLDTVVCLGCGDRRPRFEFGLRLAALNPHFERDGVRLAPDGDAELDPAAVQGFRVAACRRCDGALKPDVVYFGESVPPPRVEAALRLLDRSRALLVLGSSLTVMSGYRFVRKAHREGTPVAIVNRGPTRGDGEAAVKVDGGLAETLGALLAGLGLAPA